MNSEKYNRSISLLCPTCGCIQYEYEYGADETIELAKCCSCGRKLTKDELIHENSENIQMHVSEVKEQLVKETTKKLQDSLQKAFKGSKNIRFKL